MPAPKPTAAPPRRPCLVCALLRVAALREAVLWFTAGSISRRLASARVPPLRDFFLLPENYAHCRSPLVIEFGALVRKVWSPFNFKGQVSPHELLQAVMNVSSNRFKIGAQVPRARRARRGTPLACRTTLAGVHDCWCMLRSTQWTFSRGYSTRCTLR